MSGQAAPRPTPRTVSVALKGEYAGWTCTARADFPARILADLNSGNLDRVLGALDRIVLEHNFPDENGDVAPSMADVDPYPALRDIAGGIFDAIAKLPNR